MIKVCSMCSGISIDDLKKKLSGDVEIKQDVYMSAVQNLLHTKMTN